MIPASGGIAPAAPEREGQVLLPDGRALAYAEYGDPEGTPVLYFHGLPSSRLEGALAAFRARAMGLRLIAFDRPGFGQSGFKMGRTYGAWPADVSSAAASLGLSRFSVLGTSGGGPHALACAALLPERVRAAAVICGLGRVSGSKSRGGFVGFSRFALGFAGNFPALLPALCIPVALGLKTRAVEIYLEHLANRLPSLDRETLLDPGIRSALALAFRESVRHGHRGPCHELHMAAQPWDFDPGSIRVPLLMLHGEEDQVVPASMTRDLAQAIPRAWARFYPGEGHYSLPVRHVGEVLEFLAGAT